MSVRSNLYSFYPSYACKSYWSSSGNCVTCKWSAVLVGPSSLICHPSPCLLKHCCRSKMLLLLLSISQMRPRISFDWPRVTYLKEFQGFFLFDNLLMGLIVLLSQISKCRSDLFFLFISSFPRWNEVVRLQKCGSLHICLAHIQPIFVHHDLLRDYLLPIVLITPNPVRSKESVTYFLASFLAKSHVHHFDFLQLSTV